MSYLRLAIYSRKSKFTGKGESVENQIQLCREYINQHYTPVEDVAVYEDEGYSGGTIDRPQFKQMLKDAQKKKFSVLICYRLDRISRNVSDFSNLITEFQKWEIGFVSIREQFDTTTPMGRAMMYIASVFAQLERETIAERIQDNMLQLAKSGRWLGGITPLGYISKEISSVNESGKEKKCHILDIKKAESDIVPLIFSKFIELKSLTKLETYLLNNSIFSRRGKIFSRYSLKSIICNPVYAIADNALLDYFTGNGYEVYSDPGEFDGSHGVMAYNKTNQKYKDNKKFRDPDEWVIAVGMHPGIIDSKLWIQAQSIIDRNKSKSYRNVKNNDSLLSGILKCADCGSYMRPRTVNRADSQGKQKFYYMCELKEKSRRVLCNVKNAFGNELDSLVIEELKKLSQQSSGLSNKLSEESKGIEWKQNDIIAEIKNLEAALNKNELSIKNLTGNLSISQESSAAKYIIEKINEIDNQSKKLKDKLVELQGQKEKVSLNQNAMQMMEVLLSNFSSTIDSLNTEEKRNLIKGLTDTITWNGDSVDIHLFGSHSFPQCEYSK